MSQKFTNAARSPLMASINAGDTSITVDIAKADLFPVADTNTSAIPTIGKDWFKIVLEDSSHNLEIVYVRTRSSGSASMTNCLRGQEGTTARSYLAGSIVGLRHTATDLADAISFASGASSFWRSQVGWTTAALSRAGLEVRSIAESDFQSGTRMPFAQAAAPTGWTQDTSDNATNRMLRVVNTAGNGVGGSHSAILNSVVPNHTHGFTTGTVSAGHTHSVIDPGHSHTTEDYGPDYAGGASGVKGFYPYTNGTLTGASTTGISLGGITANHTHSGSTDNGSSGTNWTPRYIDLIICEKD